MTMRAANDALRFFLELGALASLGYWGWQATSGPSHWALMLAAPAVAALVWGLFVSPKARVPVEDPWRLALEVLFFGSATAALLGADQALLAVIFGAAVIVHLASTFALGQRRGAPIAWADRGL